MMMIVLATTAAMALVAAAPALAEEPGDNHEEYQCSPGLLGTGIACSNSGDDLFQGGPLGGDSELADAVRGLFG